MPKKVRKEAKLPRGSAGVRQLDLLVALPGDIPTHDQQDMMERPFFSLSKQRRTEPIDYQVQNGSTTISVNVTAPAEIGIATIWDADILIWAASQLREANARGVATSPTFKVSLYELLRGIDRRTSGDEYHRIVEAFERLSGTLIRTNIRQGKRKKPEGFHWIERYAAPTDEEGRPAGIEFTIADWLYLRGPQRPPDARDRSRVPSALPAGSNAGSTASSASTAAINPAAGLSRWLSSTSRAAARSGWRISRKSFVEPLSGSVYLATGYSFYGTQKVRRSYTSQNGANSR